MNIGKWIFLIALAILASVDVEAQAIKPMLGWRYIAVKNDFWTKFTKDLSAEAHRQIVNSALDYKGAAQTDAELNESRLALAKGFRAMGYVQSAFYLLCDIIETSPNSFAANEALLELSQIVPNEQVDEERLSRIINRSSPVELPLAAIPMVAYYLVTDHLRMGQVKWMKGYIPLIDTASYWGARLEYFRALEALKADKVAEAQIALTALEKHPAVGASLLHSIRLQLARLLFEQKDYVAAEKIYATLYSSDRNSGRVLYERAWNQYYLKDYALTLGMLESLKAPLFSRAVEPEQFVLAALVLRDLCHYPEVRRTNKEFFRVFNPTINHIRNDKNLRDNSVLMSMALIREPIRSLADVVDAVQKEGRRLKQDFSTDRLAFLRERFEKVEAEIRGRLSHRLEEPLRFEAQRVLEMADQMKLLDYVSGLDENRIQGLFESRGYTTETPDTLRFKTLYWPLRAPATDNEEKKNKKEYWFQELNNMRVLISDRCEGAGL